MEKLSKKLYLCEITDYGNVEYPLKIRTFGNWIIDRDGDIIHKQGKMTIEKSRLSETDWFSHLLGKSYMVGEWNDFIQCYWTACKLANIKSVQMDIDI